MAPLQSLCFWPILILVQAAKTYVSSALFDPRGNGLLGSVVANSTVQPGWGWETIGGASVTQWTPVSATGPTEAAGAVTMRFPGAAEQHVRLRAIP